MDSSSNVYQQPADSYQRIDDENTDEKNLFPTIIPQRSEPSTYIFIY